MEIKIAIDDRVISKLAFIFRKQHITALSFLVMLFTAGYVISEELILPHSFQNGQVADANEINTNFNALTAKINEQSAQIESLNTQVQTLSDLLSDVSNTAEKLVIGSETKTKSLHIYGALEAEEGLKQTVVSFDFFGHDQGRSEGVRAPDGTRTCSVGHYMCGLKYDHWNNDITIEPVCCSVQ